MKVRNFSIIIISSSICCIVALPNALPDDMFQPIYRAPLDFSQTLTSQGFPHTISFPADVSINRPISVRHFSLPVTDNNPSSTNHNPSVNSFPSHRNQFGSPAPTKGHALPATLRPRKSPSNIKRNSPVFRVHSGDYDDSDEDTDSKELGTHSSVFIKIGNSETDYSIQHPFYRAKSFAQDIDFVKSGAVQPTASKESEEEDEHTGYSYSYTIQSATPSHRSGPTASKPPNFGHTEAREGATTKGQYYVNLPDGRLQIVEYYADETGYHPTIRYV